MAGREIHQGDVFWIAPDALTPAVPGQPHPHVVIQADVLNRSRIATVVVCGLTSNLQRLGEPGNVLLEVGEANLPRPSVVIVSQVSTVEKAQLGAYVGALYVQRVEQILAGLALQQRSFFSE